MLNNTDLLIHSVFIYFLLLFTYLVTFVFRQRLIFYWVLPRLFHPLSPYCHPNPSIHSQTSPKDHTAFISGKPLPVASRVVLAKPLAKHARLTSHRIAMAKCWLLPPVRDLGSRWCSLNFERFWKVDLTTPMYWSISAIESSAINFHPQCILYVKYIIHPPYLSSTSIIYTYFW